MEVHIVLVIDHMSHPKFSATKLKRYVAEHGEEPTWRSVNDGIRKSECPVDFPRFDEVVDKILEAGRGCWLACRDYADAYPHLLINPSDWGLMAKQHPEGLWYCGAYNPFSLICTATYK